ncbi:MAG: ferrochelatase [Thermoprotei archaeon]
MSQTTGDQGLRSLKSTCVILWHYGSPERLEDIPAFLSGIVPPSMLTSYTEIYSKKYSYIGWSPQNHRVNSLANKLKLSLNGGHAEFGVLTGSKHWKPSLKGSLELAVKKGFNRAFVIPLIPFRSKWLLSEYTEALSQWVGDNRGFDVTLVDGFYDHPAYVSNWVEQIRALLDELSDQAGKTAVVTSFHAIPLGKLSQEEAYLEQTKWLHSQVALKLPDVRTELSYQSAATTRVKWSKPSVVETMIQLSREDYSNIVVAPMGFVYDHLETIFDIDVVLKEAGIVAGVNVFRVPAPNDSDWFATMLAELVRANARA